MKTIDEDKMKQLLKELERIKVVKDGGITAGLLFDVVNKFSVMKGEPGKTPQKFVDYFTDKEFKQVADDIYRMVKAQIRWPEDGKTPLAGKDYPTHDQVETVIRKYVALIPRPKDGERGEPGLDGADGSPDTPEVIVSKLESIDEEDDKLKIEAIKDLRKELDELKKEVKSKGQVIYAGGGGGSRRNTTKYDLSSQLNGVLKTFSLPAFWDVVSVHSGGSIPTTFRPLTDYTTDASASTITFTSEINEATTLAAGQTILVVYNEP